MEIVLVGNPNVGKSVIFNALTKSYVTVSNYPGTTVEISRGAGKFGDRRYNVIDTPGINGLTPHSEDEKVTRDILSESGIACIVQIADSKNLKRALMLTLELARLEIPMVLALNMSDEAKERGIKIDTKKLSEKLGITVVETVAVTGEGLGKVKEAIPKASVPRADLADEPAQAISAPRRIERRARIVDRLAAGVLSAGTLQKSRLSEHIGRITIRPVTGIPILIAVVYLMYLFVGRFAAGTLVDFFETKVFKGIVNPFFITMADKFIPVTVIKDFLVGEYGIMTMAFTYAFAIIFPIVTTFFLFFGVLEDSGYLPRLSVLSDRIFRTIGLNGRAILPVILGLGCGTMATLTARILDTKKERILVSLLLTLAIPCSAQLGVIMGMLGTISGKALLLWLGIILFVTIAVGYAAAKVIPGKRSLFIQEVPPIRMPQIKNIIAKTFARLKWYLKEAVPLFVLGTAILFVFDKAGLLKSFEKILSPLVVNLLNLPEKATEAFIIGFLRRDYGAAGLYVLSKQGMLDNIQVLVSAVVITLFVPCIAQFFVTVKERGIKTACAIGGFVFIFAFLAGGVLNFVLRYLTLNLGVPVI